MVLMMEGATIEEASELAFGKAWSEIDSDWRASVEADVQEREAKKAEQEAEEEAEEAAKEKNQSLKKGEN